MSGLPRLGWVCYRFVYAGTIKPNAVMPAHGLHSVRYLALLTWLIMFTARFDALPNPFRVACFRARRSTHVTVFSTFHRATGVGLGASQLSNALYNQFGKDRWYVCGAPHYRCLPCSL